jgi:hypothetical protein
MTSEDLMVVVLGDKNATLMHLAARDPLGKDRTDGSLNCHREVFCHPEADAVGWDTGLSVSDVESDPEKKLCVKCRVLSGREGSESEPESGVASASKGQYVFRRTISDPKLAEPDQARSCVYNPEIDGNFI